MSISEMQSALKSAVESLSSRVQDLHSLIRCRRCHRSDAHAYRRAIITFTFQKFDGQGHEFPGFSQMVYWGPTRVSRVFHMVYWLASVPHPIHHPISSAGALAHQVQGGAKEGVGRSSGAGGVKLAVGLQSHLLSKCFTGHVTSFQGFSKWFTGGQHEFPGLGFRLGSASHPTPLQLHHPISSSGALAHQVQGRAKEGVGGRGGGGGGVLRLIWPGAGQEGGVTEAAAGVEQLVRARPTPAPTRSSAPTDPAFAPPTHPRMQRLCARRLRRPRLRSQHANRPLLNPT